MAHVDLSLSGLDGADSDRLLGGYLGSLDLWSRAVVAAGEPCLLLDVDGVVMAASPGCADLFGIDVRQAVGRRLVDGVLQLLDFNAVTGDLPRWEVDKIPPRIAATTGGLARGLIRTRAGDGSPCTVDAISVPLRDGDSMVGSLSFFALVAR